MTDVWVVLDFTAQEGGFVIYVGDSLQTAQRAAEDDHEGPLEWSPVGDRRFEADKGTGGTYFYVVERWPVSGHVCEVKP